MNRRNVLKLFGAAAAGALLPRPAWAAATPSDEFFILVHASGGWDVTLWADPRNERKGLVEPASSENSEIEGITHWKRARLDGGIDTFEILAPSDSKLRLGPAIGDLYDLRDRLTVFNGLEMNTVSHPDGVTFSVTGRHLAGGHVAGTSLDVALVNELGVDRLVPGVAIRFPSAYVGANLDPRAVPLRVDDASAFAASLARNDAYLDGSDRDAISHLLGGEALGLGSDSEDHATYQRLSSQLETQPRLLGPELRDAFTAKALQARYPGFNYKAQTVARGALSAAFALEGIRRQLVRCVSFSLGSFDSHGASYKQHARMLQDSFGVIAQLVAQLDAIPHPNKPTARLSEHTHILMFSDFCRTPAVNLAGGRDHYPNNSALVISPKFKGGRAYGKTDLEQLLPADDGRGRVITPPDLLVTFLQAFSVDPRRYFRDGQVLADVI